MHARRMNDALRLTPTVVTDGNGWLRIEDRTRLCVDIECMYPMVNYLRRSDLEGVVLIAGLGMVLRTQLLEEHIRIWGVLDVGEQETSIIQGTRHCSTRWISRLFSFHRRGHFEPASAFGGCAISSAATAYARPSLYHIESVQRTACRELLKRVLFGADPRTMGSDASILRFEWHWSEGSCYSRSRVAGEIWALRHQLRWGVEHAVNGGRCGVKGVPLGGRGCVDRLCMDVIYVYLEDWYTKCMLLMFEGVLGGWLEVEGENVIPRIIGGCIRLQQMAHVDLPSPFLMVCLSGIFFGYPRPSVSTFMRNTLFDFD
ncbi:hypothetical protein BDN70DRAFT_901918 [Pholiota conissans]|uniref:Uncharacterized protein n=1 Tax=Pholiota conissans TaxID=109636 RepID=A0A9P5YKN8_9AGAR|nr:hypothetical protein BDN70DRAFT_901918 [Pholiota conissans]